MSSISTHPWQQLGTSDALMSELHRELAPGHALFGVPLNAIARRLDSDDVLVSLNDGSGRVALVHLTWRGKPERTNALEFAFLLGPSRNVGQRRTKCQRLAVDALRKDDAPLSVEAARFGPSYVEAASRAPQSAS